MQAKAIHGQRFSLVEYTNRSNVYKSSEHHPTSYHKQETTPNVFRDGYDIVRVISNFGIGKSHDPDVLSGLVIPTCAPQLEFSGEMLCMHLWPADHPWCLV
jgi:hypothetical protein